MLSTYKKVRLKACFFTKISMFFLLPNISGKIDRLGPNTRTTIPSGTGAFYTSSAPNVNAGDIAATGTYMNFDASRANSIYGSSSEVQPKSFTTIYLIKS